jgi:hypothetical protein
VLLVPAGAPAVALVVLLLLILLLLLLQLLLLLRVLLQLLLLMLLLLLLLLQLLLLRFCVCLASGPFCPRLACLAALLVGLQSPLRHPLATNGALHTFLVLVAALALQPQAT